MAHPFPGIWQRERIPISGNKSAHLVKPTAIAAVRITYSTTRLHVWQDRGEEDAPPTMLRQTACWNRAREVAHLAARTVWLGPVWKAGEREQDTVRES